MNLLQEDCDPYEVEELSDEELTPSSTKEVDVLLHGTLGQK